MKKTNYIFKRIIFGTLIIALLVAIGIAIYKNCKKQEKTTQVEDDVMLVKIESHFSYAIMYDKDTKVMYFRGLSASADLCPLYNADGSLKLYSGGNNND